MRHRETAKVEVFKWPNGRETDIFERLKYAAACKLRIWHRHLAGGGSSYVLITQPGNDENDVLKLRFADHDNTSTRHPTPDFNFVNRDPSEEELQEIMSRVQDARLCKKTAFAKHVGLTVPKLKKHLTPECLESVDLSFGYTKETTEYVVVAEALQRLEAAGVVERNPVRQEIYSREDFSGH